MEVLRTLLKPPKDEEESSSSEGEESEEGEESLGSGAQAEMGSRSRKRGNKYGHSA